MTDKSEVLSDCAIVGRLDEESWDEGSSLYERVVVEGLLVSCCCQPRLSSSESLSQVSAL